MRRASLAVASLAAVATFATSDYSCRAADELKVAVGGRGIGETFVTEVGDKAGLFKRHNLALDIFYTDGGGETQQAVISNSAQVGIASGFLGAIGVFAKGAPVRIIGGSYTGGAQVFWYVPADSPIRGPQDLVGKTVAYSNNGSSTHAGVLALQRHYNIDFKPVPTGNAAATMTATMSGQVDVGWAGAPFGVAELEAGKTRLIMKSSDAPDFDKQTNRVIIVNAAELKARADVFVRFMRGYRDALAWVYSTPEGLAAYAAFAKLSPETARRALREFLPPAAVDPDRISGLEEVMADAVKFKFIPAPLSKDDLAELIRIPERRQ
jgi:NitT/TauT family transport system substrate-binding protein